MAMPATGPDLAQRPRTRCGCRRHCARTASSAAPPDHPGVTRCGGQTCVAGAPTASVPVVEPAVVLIGGAPGGGKTRVARPLAARLAMDLTHVDDFYTVLEHMTEPDQFPAVHAWRLHPERVLALDGPGMIEHTRQVSEIVAQALAPVIADRFSEHIRSVSKATSSSRRSPPPRRSRVWRPKGGWPASSFTTRSSSSRPTSAREKKRTSRSAPRSRGTTASGCDRSARPTACRPSPPGRGRPRSTEPWRRSAAKKPPAEARLDPRSRHRPHRYARRRQAGDGKGSDGLALDDVTPLRVGTGARLPTDVRPRRAVILAAGRSERMGRLTAGGSKALLRLGGLPLVATSIPRKDPN